MEPANHPLWQDVATNVSHLVAAGSIWVIRSSWRNGIVGAGGVCLAKVPQLALGRRHPGGRCPRNARVLGHGLTQAEQMALLDSGCMSTQ